jgi:hypothetical protein
LSSAILYLAIVAIWACVLVPRWLHRSHDATRETDVLIVEEDIAEVSGHAEFGPPGDADHDAYAGSDEADPTTYIDPALAESAAEAGAEAGASDYSSVEVRYDVEVRSDYTARSDHADRSDYAGRIEYASHIEYTGRSQADARRGPGRPLVRPSGPVPGRAGVLQARRRMLTMLVALAIAATACVLTGLTRWWTAIPPLAMVGMYLLLLREAARADVEAVRQARVRARAARMAREGARMEYERAREANTLAGEDGAPRPAAEIIDISGRADQVGDQIYDQYADATVRAVGD